MISRRADPTSLLQSKARLQVVWSVYAELPTLHERLVTSRVYPPVQVPAKITEALAEVKH
jgi:hypothetical protein